MLTPRVHAEQSRRSEGLHSCLYQLWSAVLASRNNALVQHRLPVTSSYQLPPLLGDQQQASKFNPFINSPPLTADVDTNRSAVHTAYIVPCSFMCLFFIAYLATSTVIGDDCWLFNGCFTFMPPFRKQPNTSVFVLGLT